MHYRETSKSNPGTLTATAFIMVILFCCVTICIVWWFFPHPITVIGLALLPFSAYLSLRASFPIVLGFILFSFFRLHEVMPVLEPFKIPQLLAIGSIYVVFWRIILSRNLHVYWSKEFTLLTLFFLFVTFGLFVSMNPEVAIQAWKSSYSKIFLMVIIIAWLMREEKDFALATRAFCISGFIVAGTAIYNKLNGIGLVEGTRVTIGRDIGSILGDPNDLALVLLFPATFTLSVMIEKRLAIFERGFAFICFILLFWAVIATQSRGGLLGILSVCGFYVYYSLRSKMVLLVAGISGGLLLFVIAGISSRSTGTEAGVDASAMGRLYAWEAAWGMAMDNPLTGVGLNNFWYNYFYYTKHWDGINHSVHSTWFGVLAETGFFGFFIFMSMVVVVLKSSIKLLNRSKCIDLQPFVSIMVHAIPAGLIGFIVSGTFLTQGFTWPLYIQIAISMAVIHLVDGQYKANFYRS